MTRISFNAGWTARPKTSVWEQLTAPDDGATVTLPHDALIDAQRTADGSGKTAYFPQHNEIEYLKTFDVPQEWAAKRVALEFQGAYRDAMVYVNGAFAGHRANGYTTFIVDLDDYLRFGEPNTVRVEVRTADDTRWYSGAGLYRDAVLLVDDLVHVSRDGIVVRTPEVDDELAVVEVDVPVVNAGLHQVTATVETRVLDADGAQMAAESTPVTVRARSVTDERHRLYLERPHLWNTDDPYLYRVEVTVRGEGTTDLSTAEPVTAPLGIRTLRLDPHHGLRINGRVTKLRGACIHHDNGILGAAAIGRAEERRIEQLLAAGFNAVRSSHNPMSQRMLDACDRLGMLVMDEAFDMWTQTKSPLDYATDFDKWWREDIEAMVRKDRNHPSVVLYSIGNEIPEAGNPQGAELGRRLTAAIRRLDDTRFVTNGVNGFVSVLDDIVGEMKSRMGDALTGGVNAAGNAIGAIATSPAVTARVAEATGTGDVVGVNYAEGRYAREKDERPNRVILGTETFPAHIAEIWSLVEEYPHVLGDFTWTGYDYLGETGIGRMRYGSDDSRALEAPFPWIAAWCGDLDLTGHRRPQSYYREIVFGLRAEPYLAVKRVNRLGLQEQPHLSQWSWPEVLPSWTWDTAAGTAMEVHVYSDADEVELLCNGISAGRVPAGRRHAFTATFTVPYRPGELRAVAYRGGAAAQQTVLRTAGDDLALDVQADREQIAADEHDLAFVTIELRDAAGVLVHHRDPEVEVLVTGAGVLQGLGTGRPATTEPFTATTCTLFEGRALAAVRPTGPGTITVTVTAAGHPPVTRTITAA